MNDYTVIDDVAEEEKTDKVTNEGGKDNGDYIQSEDILKEKEQKMSFFTGRKKEKNEDQDTIIRMARKEAERILNEANFQANGIIFEANNKADKIRSEAKHEADEILKKAKEDADRFLNEAKLTLQRATDKADKIRDNAEKTAKSELSGKIKETIQRERNNMIYHCAEERIKLQQCSTDLQAINNEAISVTNKCQGELMRQLKLENEELLAGIDRYQKLLQDFKTDYYTRISEWQNDLHLPGEKCIARFFLELYDKVYRNSDKLMVEEIIGNPIETGLLPKTKEDLEKFFQTLKNMIRRLETVLGNFGMFVYFPEIGTPFDAGNQEFYDLEEPIVHPIVKAVVTPAVLKKNGENETLLIEKAVVKVCEQKTSQMEEGHAHT